jgi:hypothetical protein
MQEQDVQDAGYEIQDIGYRIQDGCNMLSKKFCDIM